MRRIKIYVCPYCGSCMYGLGDCVIVCCGKPLSPLKSKIPDDNHTLNISEIENDYYIEINHEMTKDHYIEFIMYVGIDRTLMVRMYPEQDPKVRLPKMRGGRFYYYCNNHGLYELKY